MIRAGTTKFWWCFFFEEGVRLPRRQENPWSGGAYQRPNFRRAAIATITNAMRTAMMLNRTATATTPAAEFPTAR